MTYSSSAAGLLRAIARAPSPELDIPLVTCPDCAKRRPMTIRKVVPHMRASEGAEVEYACATCGKTERRSVKPISE
jgi:DNA-directed RNA polymerase subunit RPC12/RpoP